MELYTPVRIIVPDDSLDGGLLTKMGIEREFKGGVSVDTYQTIGRALDEIGDVIDSGGRGIVVSDVHMGPGARAYVEIFELYRKKSAGLPTIFTTTVLNQPAHVNNHEPMGYRPNDGETLGDVIVRTAPDFVPVEAIGRSSSFRDPVLYDALRKIIADLDSRQYSRLDAE